MKRSSYKYAISLAFLTFFILMPVISFYQGTNQVSVDSETDSEDSERLTWQQQPKPNDDPPVIPYPDGPIEPPPPRPPTWTSIEKTYEGLTSI